MPVDKILAIGESETASSDAGGITQALEKLGLWPFRPANDGSLEEGNQVSKPYLLFDVGGTLVYPDPEVTAQVCSDWGYQLSAEEILSSFFATLYRMDCALRETGSVDWTDSFLPLGLVAKGVASKDAVDIIAETKARKLPQGLWTFTYPVVRETLHRLQTAGFRMAAISNSDGTVEQQLRDVGLAGYFHRVFDSAVVGVEKPDSKIFHVALAELGLEPDACIYVGDVFMLDVQGANRAGLRAVHIDNSGLYQDWPGLHFSHVSQLADALIDGTLALDDERLTVFRS